MKFAIVTAFHGRPHISRIFFEGIRRLKDEGHDVIVCAAVTKGDTENADLCLEHGAYFEFHDNADLAAKFNAACSIAEPHAPDCVIILGSDDLISGEYLREVNELLEQGHLYIVPGTLAFYAERQAYIMGDPLISPTMLRYGAGRVYAYRLMQLMGWRPWPPGKPFRRGLDTVSHNRVVNIHPKMHISSTEKAHVLDVKSSANMWKMDRLGPKCKKVPAERAMWFLSDAERELIAAI